MAPLDRAPWRMRQGIGRSQSGFTTKIYLRVNAARLAMRTDITPGQATGYLGFALAMDANLPEPFVLRADMGYDADSIRDDMRSRYIQPVIPM